MRKVHVIETCTYEVEIPDDGTDPHESALKIFLESENVNQYFFQVDDRDTVLVDNHV
jgi:hypothetical protein